MDDRAKAAWLERVTASIDELVFVTELTGRMLWTNATFERETGFTAADFQFRQPDNPFIHPDDAARVGGFLAAFAASGADRSGPIENRFFDRWGAVRAYRSEVFRTTAEGAPALLYVCREQGVTGTPDADLETSFRALVEAAPDAILKLAADGRLLHASPKLHALLGCQPSDLTGRGLPELAVDPDGVRAALARGGSFDLELIDARGERHACEATVAPLGVDQRIVVLRDVTEARRRDDELRRAQKLEAIGRLAGGVAHDFNNMLSAILAYGELAAARTRGDAQTSAHLAQIRLAAQRAARLTAQLLAFGKRQVLAPAAVDLGEVADEMASMLRSLIGDDVELRVALAPCGAVRADRGQLEQVVLNLVLNARDAMPRGGTIDLSVGEVVLDGGGAGDGATRRRHARLSVVDHGVGMSEADVARATEPFFTTRPSGTGLGLSTVHGVVQQSGGRLAIDSAPGRGTRVDVLLPIDEAAAAATSSRRDGDGHRTRARAVILLVEDEPLVRNAVRQLLRHLGHDVVTAASPAEALALLAGGLQTDLVFTDFSMPGMNGLELIEQIRATRPGCRALVMSGFAADSGDEPAGVPAGVRFVAKPIALDALQAALAEALGAPPVLDQGSRPQAAQ